jgi:hypothetical protein
MFAPVPKFLIIAAAAVLVLVPVREAAPPNLNGKKCFVAGDCDWGDLAPDAEIIPGVTAKEFSKQMWAIVEAVTGPVQKIYDDPGGNVGGFGTFIGSMQAEVPNTKFLASVRLPARSFSVLLTNPTCVWVQRLASDFIRRAKKTAPLP